MHFYVVAESRSLEWLQANNKKIDATPPPPPYRACVFLRPGGAGSQGRDGLLFAADRARLEPAAGGAGRGVRGGLLRPDADRRPGAGSRDQGAHDGSRENEAGMYWWAIYFRTASSI